MGTVQNIVDRERFTWKVSLSDDKGTTTVYPFSSFWSPSSVSNEFVALSAAAEASAIGGRKYLPVGCERA